MKLLPPDLEEVDRLLAATRDTYLHATWAGNTEAAENARDWIDVLLDRRLRLVHHM